MTETQRHLKPIIETLIEQYHNAPNSEGQLWRSYQRVLEAAAAELGVDRLLHALDKQGIAGYSYKSHVQFLVEEANSRRLDRNGGRVTEDAG